MKWILFGCFLLLLGLFSQAQKVSGYVRDPDNNGIPDVNILVSETGVGTITDKNGFFIIENLQHGRYNLKFICLGYKTESKDIHLQKNSDLELNIVLKSDVYITDEIVIQADKDIEETVLDIPVRSKTFTIQEINSTPAISTYKILEGISGVNVSSEAGMFSSTDVTMRGLGGNTKGGTLVVLDGSPINKSDAGSVNWSMIDKDNISTIEVIKGPGSVIFGSNAMGGIINIVSRKPSEKFSANLSSSYGTYNTFDGKLRLSGINSQENLYWKSFFSYRNSDGYINTPDEIILENDSIVVPVFLEEYMISGLVGCNLNEKNSVELSVNYFDDTKGRGTKIYEFAGANTQRNTVHSFAKYRGQIKSVKLFVNIFTLFEDYFRLNEYYSDGEYALYEINSDRLENGAKFLSQYFLTENIEITAGAEYKRGSVNGSDIYYTSTDKIKNKGSSNIYSGFAQVKIKIPETKFTFVPGVRYDYAVFNNASFIIEYPSYSIEYLSEFQFEMTEPVHWSSFSPKFSLEYAFSDKNKLFATVAKGFRAPVLDDLCRSDQVKTGFRVANPEISAEYLYSFEIGGDFELFEGFYAGVSGYYNIGKDFMYLLSTGDSVNMGYTIAPIYQTDNIGEVNIYGVETDLSYSFNKLFNVFVNHTWNRSVITEFIVNPEGAGVDLTGKFLTDIPDHKISGGVAFFNKIINVSSSANYTGKRWIKDDNSIETSYFLTDKYPSYTTFDLKLWRSYRNFDFSITIDNILNKIYTNSKGYKCPGRMIIFEVKFNLKYDKDEN
ncbi:MAG TPA: TonB-dependent receptor [Bacteroidales bacterium]|nr:TonB-dependent receptor [Bacteroidales bacterium]